MKLVLASYFENENHGPGRKIGISPGKPRAAEECDLRFDPFDPGQAYWDYHEEKKIDPSSAGAKFVETYRQQLEDFVSLVETQAKDNEAICLIAM